MLGNEYACFFRKYQQLFSNKYKYRSAGGRQQEPRQLIGKTKPG